MTINQMLHIDWVVSRVLRRKNSPHQTLKEAAWKHRGSRNAEIRAVAMLVLDDDLGEPWERMRKAAIIGEPILMGASK